MASQDSPWNVPPVDSRSDIQKSYLWPAKAEMKDNPKALIIAVQEQTQYQVNRNRDLSQQRALRCEICCMLQLPLSVILKCMFLTDKARGDLNHPFKYSLPFHYTCEEFCLQCPLPCSPICLSCYFSPIFGFEIHIFQPQFRQYSLQCSDLLFFIYPLSFFPTALVLGTFCCFFPSTFTAVRLGK